MNPFQHVSDEDLLRTFELVSDYNVSHAGRVLGLTRATIRHRLRLAEQRLGLSQEKPLAAGRSQPRIVLRRAPPKSGVKRYLLTCAQNNTHLHQPFWRNLLAFAKHIDAEIMVSLFSYNKTAYGIKAVKPGKAPTPEDSAQLWYEEELKPFVMNERVELAPGLLFCGETNILPTASRPLQGFETYTGRASGIFPHAKQCLESVAASKGHAAKFNYTTGVCTLRNYVARAAGFKAEHHHIYGALVVEVDSDGNWFVRQIQAEDETGAFHDLTVRVEGGEVHESSVEAINWGDVHVQQLDSAVRQINWGSGGILDVLHPRLQFMHDTIDFRARNHHDRGNPHSIFEKFIKGIDDVQREFEQARDFLETESRRPWCQTVVVDSNHDNALERWLREADYRWDPLNAVFFLECQLAKYRAIRDRDSSFHLCEHMLRSLGLSHDIRFLREDESFVICGVIECGMHGHLGPNGVQGSPRNLSRMGRKANTGHTHSAQILDGMYVAGTSSELDMGYNRGPSSWSHSHIVTYPNGKRAIITIWNGKWRGEP